MDTARLQFARTLRAMMHDKGWNQSELARRAELGRDNISGYIRGRTLPNSRHLDRLARALSVEPGTLMGKAYVERFPAGEETILRIEQVEGESGVVRLQVAQRVTIAQATRIMEILQRKGDCDAT
mgnify:CR=1 FL=1